MENRTVNLIPEGHAATFHVSEGDDGREIQLDLTEELTGTEPLVLRFKKPDATVGSFAVPSASGASVVVTIPAAMTDVPGFVYCKLRVGGIGTKSFFVKIERRP